MEIQPETHRLNPLRAPIEGLARHGIMRYVPNKPEAVHVLYCFVMTTCRYLLQRCPFLATSLCCKKRELLPFVTELKHSRLKPCKFYGFEGAIMPLPHSPCIPVTTHPMAGIHITDIESAINYRRDKKPSPDGFSLEPEIRALAEVYALMIFYHEVEADEFSFPPQALAAWLAWYETTPDTPCIAICSTSQGDEMCKGCGRTFAEVQYWTEMRPVEKRQTWRRITMDGTSWRFNKYAERAAEKFAESL